MSSDDALLGGLIGAGVTLVIADRMFNLRRKPKFFPKRIKKRRL